MGVNCDGLDFTGMGFEIIHICWIFLTFKLALLNLQKFNELDFPCIQAGTLDTKLEYCTLSQHNKITYFKSYQITDVDFPCFQVGTP